VIGRRESVTAHVRGDRTDYNVASWNLLHANVTYIRSISQKCNNPAWYIHNNKFNCISQNLFFSLSSQIMGHHLWKSLSPSVCRDRSNRSNESRTVTGRQMKWTQSSVSYGGPRGIFLICQKVILWFYPEWWNTLASRLEEHHLGILYMGQFQFLLQRWMLLVLDVLIKWFPFHFKQEHRHRYIIRPIYVWLSRHIIVQN
jgi:hypothetical protein